MEDERVSLIAMSREDARNRKRNYLRDNAEVVSFLSRVGGQNSASPYSGVFPKRTT
jgi:DNA-binding transcriptional regulator WhiA